MVLKVLQIGLVVLAVVGVALFGYRALRQHQAGQRMALSGSHAIDETGFVRIGGIPQWVSIRGEDRRNPVLVVFHGGPGAAFQIIGYEAMRPWEKDFTVVQWDQRGAGRTFGRNGADGSGALSIDRMAQDGVEVVQHALSLTGQSKAIVLGASWGSILGVEVARRRPDLLHAYVGAGQVADMQANEAEGYKGLMARLKARGETKAQAQLAEIGPPPYASLDVLLRQRKILTAHPPASERGLVTGALAAALSAPGARLADVADWLGGQTFSTNQLYVPMMTYSDLDDGRSLAVPVVVIQGDEDIQTPTILAKAWLEGLQAPRKDFVLITGGGHNALLTLPGPFLAALNEHVRPLAVR